MGLLFAIVLLGLPVVAAVVELIILSGAVYRPPPLVPRIVKTPAAPLDRPPSG